jgi:hypothetical protein
MIAGNKECFAFRDYLFPLNKLEEAFQSAGEKIEFHLKLSQGKGRYVEILCQGKPVNVQSIEGDSPAQAVKDVAGAVRL